MVTVSADWVVASEVVAAAWVHSLALGGQMGQAAINKGTSGIAVNQRGLMTNLGVSPLHCSSYGPMQRSHSAAGTEALPPHP